MTKIKLFEMLLTKEVYTKEEVEQLLLGTYEGFINSLMKNKPYEPKKRWLEFQDVTPKDRKTKVFQVINKKERDILGLIKWNPFWRQYIFDDGEIIMAEGCQYEVFEKIKELRESREKG